jgi:hypothetical protein
MLPAARRLRLMRRWIASRARRRRAARRARGCPIARRSTLPRNCFLGQPCLDLCASVEEASIRHPTGCFLLLPTY